jgi:phosphate transport system substrate-binding protein
MKDAERDSILSERGAPVAEIAVALDALAVYLNTANPVGDLSIEQMSGIYRGEITNWSEVGGPDVAIVLYGRENSSGTYAFFREHVMNEADFAPAYQALSGTAGVVAAVEADPAGVGYGGIGAGQGVKTLPIRPTPEGDPVEPTMANVLSNTYPLSRNLYFYTVGEPVGLMAEYIDWILSPEGQEIVEETGYYPLRPETAPSL